MVTNAWNSILLIIISLFSTAAFCHKSSGHAAKNGIEKETCPQTEFNKNDSAGELTGTAIKLTEMKKYKTSRSLFVNDKSNDTIIFRIEPDEVEGFFEDSLRSGKCVTVKYVTEIVDEDGVELNRFFHAKKIVFP
jgi:hypothetical protein